MIKNIIFDVGDVLMHFTWDKYVNELFNGDEALIEKVNASIWGPNNRFNEFDKDILPEEEVIASMRDYDRSVCNEVVEALSHMERTMESVDYAEKWILDLKSRGYKVYYLSNLSPIVRRNGGHVFDFLELMDGGILSYEVHLVKPDRAIYRELKHKYGLKPEECVFIDDKPTNVDAGIAYGYHGLIFKGYETTKTELDKILTEVS